MIFRYLYFFLLLFYISNPFSAPSKVENGAELTTEKELVGVNVKDYYWIIYDNVCPYCRKATKHIKALDWEGRFKFLSYRDPLTYTLFPKLSRENCEKDVHMVTPQGKVLTGYEVFREIIDNLSATKLLNPLLKNDHAEGQLKAIYEKMVKERTCYYEKTDACELGVKNNNEDLK